jgi:hypothetical protein
VLILFSFFDEFQSNPENTVGVMTMAGKGVRVLSTPTSDLGKILGCMHGMFFFPLKSLVLSVISALCYVGGNLVTM